MLVFKSRIEKGCISILVSKLYERKFVVKIFMLVLSPRQVENLRGQRSLLLSRTDSLTFKITFLSATFSSIGEVLSVRND